jgi:hypothetical protein
MNKTLKPRIYPYYVLRLKDGKKGYASQVHHRKTSHIFRRQFGSFKQTVKRPKIIHSVDMLEAHKFKTFIEAYAMCNISVKWTNEDSLYDIIKISDEACEMVYLL